MIKKNVIDVKEKKIIGLYITELGINTSALDLMGHEYICTFNANKTVNNKSQWYNE